MVAGKDANQLVKEKNLIHIIILLAIALGIGIYQITTTVLIAKDGVFYIEQARNFPNNPIGIIKGDRPFGYPFLIFVTHKLVTLLGCSKSVSTWIYCAQSVSLVCRLLAIILLYFIGKILVGSKKSFWAVLILIMLPYPAEFGSDVIREWPHILFLAWSLLFLILGSKSGKWWMFAIAGFVAGLGHMIRPECAQTVIYGSLWLLISLFLPRPNISRLKTLCLIVALLIGFAIPVTPYFKIKGEVLPPKLKELISCNTPWQSSELEQTSFNSNSGVYTASVISVNILNALIRLAQEISDNLIHFFVLPLVVGLCDQYRRIRKFLLTEWFFIFALLVMYLVIMVLLNINYGYISRRHCMPMVVFAAFYIPSGLRILAHWLNRKTSRSGLAVEENIRRWFFILVVVGFVICAAKFVRITPLRWEKQGYRDAAKWLNQNTAPTAIIAIPDKRITFYAEREGLEYGEQIPEQVAYIVRIVKSEDEKLGFGKDNKEEYSTWVDKRKKSRKLVICKVIR